MSKKVRVSERAKNDLLEIGRYTELRWGRSQRNHYLKQLDEAFLLIGNNPNIGKDRTHVLPGYRSYQQSSHVIYYRKTESVEIIRVLHERMDVSRHINET